MGLQFSESASKELDAIVAKYPQKEAALLPALHLAQQEFNHLSIEVQALVAKSLSIPPVRVHEVTTFYEMFHQHAEGQFHLEVCTNISCHLAGADCLMEHAKESLGIDVGHQSEDGVFGLMEAECLASCGSGPMLRVGKDYYEHVTTEAFDKLIVDFKKLAPSLAGKNYYEGENGPHTGPVTGFEPPEPQAVSQASSSAEEGAVEMAPEEAAESTEAKTESDVSEGSKEKQNEATENENKSTQDETE